MDHPVACDGYWRKRGSTVSPWAWSPECSSRLEAHYGARIQDYACFVETLSASELEALYTADLATMQRFKHAFQHWRDGRS